MGSIIAAIEATISSDPHRFPPTRTASVSIPSRRSSQDVTTPTRRSSKDTSSRRSSQTVSSDPPAPLENGIDNTSHSSTFSPTHSDTTYHSTEEVHTKLLLLLFVCLFVRF